jgi:hypothetical protein
MQAKITKTQHDGEVAKYRKEQHFHQEFAVLVSYQAGRVDYEPREGENMKAIINAKIYSVPSRMYGSTAYACIWISDKARGKREAVYISGGGKAGGCGYHKASAALAAAIDDAGVVLSQSISGVGDSAMREALGAIAKSLGYRTFHIHNAHG